MEAPVNSGGQVVYLAAPAKVEAAPVYSPSVGVPSGAVLQKGTGRNYILLMATSATNGPGTNIMPVANFTLTGWQPAYDSASNLWRSVKPTRQPRYVQNRGTSVVYVVSSSRTVASEGVGAALLPGSAPSYVGGVITFDTGEAQGPVSVWTLPGGRFGYGED